MPSNQTSPQLILLYLLGGLACAAYLGVVIWAAVITVRNEDPAKLDGVPSQLLTTVSAVLATNLGAYLGLTVQRMSAPGAPPWTLAGLLARGPSQDLRLIGSIVYLSGLAIGFGAWATKGFRDEHVADAIKNMTTTLGGIIAGSLAILLAPPT